jgi:hypothetical protein
MANVKLQRQLVHCMDCVQRFVAQGCRAALTGQLWVGDYSALDKVPRPPHPLLHVVPTTAL